jgi:hypothetical protein
MINPPTIEITIIEATDEIKIIRPKIDEIIIVD